MGCIVFSALAQGLLTDRYLDGIPADSRAAREGSTIPGDHLDEQTLRHVRRLNEIAEGRGQKLAQMALQWALRDPRVTSAVIGASSVEQLDTNLDALSGPAVHRRGAQGDRRRRRRGRHQPLGQADPGLGQPGPGRPRPGRPERRPPREAAFGPKRSPPASRCRRMLRRGSRGRRRSALRAAGRAGAARRRVVPGRRGRQGRAGRRQRRRQDHAAADHHRRPGPARRRGHPLRRARA